MKNFNFNLAWIAIFALVFTSCSKEETGVGLDSEKATLSFGAVISDLVANREASKQSIGEIPECSDDEPVYVRIVLLEGDTEVVGTTGEPYRVNLVPGEIITVEDPRLELEAGIYTLNHFSVYNADDQLLWLAPRGGAMANYVDESLPIDIDLRAGVKKYVDVTVLCYDNRDVNQYGYLFLEFNSIEAVEFCFFANYCDAAGKHFPASYSLDLWEGTNDSGNQIYDDLPNTVGVNGDGDFFASALCVALPSNEDLNEDYLFYRLTLLDWEGNYGDVNQTVISGTLSRADIEANFGEGDAVEYEHFRFGCGDDDEEPPVDTDGDGVPDSIDDCENTPAGTDVDEDGCPEATVVDTDGDGVPDSIDECDDVDGPASNNGCPVVDPDTDGDGVPDSIDECDDVDGPASNNGCPVVDPDTDGDGVPDSIDECDDVDGPASNNGCPVVDPDTDGDGVPDSIDECDDVDGPASNNGCPVVDPDTDGDGVPDSIDECDDVDGPASNNGCPVATTCVIEAADAGCSVAYIEGETGFYQIATPGETPTLYNLLDSNGTSIGQITVISFEGDLAILINAAADVDLDDYLVEVSQNADGSNSICFSENNFTDENADLDIFVDIPDALTYPFHIRVKVNFCT